MKKDWDELKAEYANDASKLVAEVDCRSKAGGQLCRKHGIEKHPTVKWGSADALEDYDGHRGLDAIKAFAKDSLKRTCSPSSLDECDAATKSDIEKVMSMSHTQLEDELFNAKEAHRGGADGWCNKNHYSEALKEQGTPVLEDLAACAAKCAEEAQCKSFSFAKSESCHRYDTSCEKKSVLEDERYVTYNKVAEEGGKGDLSDFKQIRAPKKENDDSEQAKARLLKNERRLGYIHTVKTMKREEL